MLLYGYNSLWVVFPHPPLATFPRHAKLDHMNNNSITLVEHLKKIGAKGRLSRWSKTTPEQRKAHSQKMLEALKKKRKVK